MHRRMTASFLANLVLKSCSDKIVFYQIDKNIKGPDIFLSQLVNAMVLYKYTV